MAMGCFKSLILIAMLAVYLGIPILLMIFGIRWFRKTHFIGAKGLIGVGTAIAVVAAVLFLPMAIGIWVPDVLYAKRHVIAHAETLSGHKFDVIQYWNRCDFYNTELIHTDPDGKEETHVLDGDDSKSWGVPISVDEKKRQVTVVLGGNRPKIVDYWRAQTREPRFGTRRQGVISVATNSVFYDEPLYGQLTFVTNAFATNYFGECHLYAVRLLINKYPTGESASLVVRSQDLPLAFDTIADAAYYVSREWKKVSTADEAEQLFDMLIGMFSYRVISHKPAHPSFVSRYVAAEFLDDAKWQKRIVETESGWKIQSMIVVDPEMHSIENLTVHITRSGRMEVISKKHVWSAATYR